MSIKSLSPGSLFLPLLWLISFRKGTQLFELHEDWITEVKSEWGKKKEKKYLPVYIITQGVKLVPIVTFLKIISFLYVECSGFEFWSDASCQFMQRSFLKQFHLVLPKSKGFC